jgi:hypothetical protein
MHIALIVTIVLHVLSGVFWAGSTFALARTAGMGAAKLFRPQMGAAVIALLSGGALWHLAHSGSLGRSEYILAAGAIAAVIAAAVQGIGVGPAVGTQAADQASRQQTRIVLAERVAALLLSITVICMAAARYA